MPALISIEPETIFTETSIFQTASAINDTLNDTLYDTLNEASVEEQDQNPEQNEQRLLVARVLQGEQDAFNDIVTHYSALMLRTASMIVGDRDIAEDVVQDALIQVWHHLPELREAGALRSWLMRIVVNQCISFKRKLARTSAFLRQSLLEQETELLAQVADDHKGRLERDWDIAHAINNLPMKQRVAIVLHYYYGMTLPEMAGTLHTSENTLKKRIQAALTNLRLNFRSGEGHEVENEPFFSTGGTRPRFSMSLP